MSFNRRRVINPRCTVGFLGIFVGLLITLPLFAQTQTTLYFADIAHGGSPSSYQTTLQLFNSSNQDTTATITIYQDNGTPFNVGLKDGQTGSALTPTSPGVFSVTIPARGLKVLTTSGPQGVQSGWVRVDSPGSGLNGNVFFQQIDGSGNLISQTGVPGSMLTSAFTGFFEKSSTVGTGVGLANPSLTVTASITLQLTSSAGLVLGSQTITLPPLQHIAQFIDQFSQFTSIGNGVGTLAISSSSNIVGTFLRQDRGQLTTVPLFAGTALAPTITSLSPTSGDSFTTVTITGTNFDVANPGNNTVTFNGVKVDIISLTASTIVVTVPKGLPTGTIPVVVNANGGASNSVNFTVTDNGFATPVITSLDPPSALVGSSSATITIHGKNFAPTVEGSYVQFGTVKPALQVTNSTNATMTLTATMLSAVGSFPVTFFNPGNNPFAPNGSNTVQFGVSNQVSTQAPTITGINPSSGRVNANVTIVGTNFDPVNVGNNIIKFNGTVATQVSSVTGTQIVCQVPAGATTGPVTVTSNGLVSNSMMFTVVQTPALQLVTVGDSPSRVAYDSVTNAAIVTNSGNSSSGNSVSFVDVANALLIKSVAIGAQNPVGIAIFGRLGIVANFAPPATLQRSVTLLNLDTQNYDSSINVNALGGPPFNLGVDASTGTAVLTDNSLHIGILNLVTKQTTQYFASSPYDVAVYNPNSSTDWAVYSDFSENKVIIFDLKTNTQLISINVGSVPQGVAVNPSTGIAVVANSGANSVSLVDLVGQTVVGTVPVGLRPNYVAVDRSRNRAVVSNNGDGTISVIDLATKTVIATLSTGGNNPAGVAINESADVAIVVNTNSNNVAIVALP